MFLKTKQNTQKNSQSEQTVDGIQSLHTILLQELCTILYFHEITDLVRYVLQGNPSPKEQILHPSVNKNVAQHGFPKVSLQIVSLNKYTTWRKFKDQKKVFKKLKLVHIQVGKKNKSWNIIRLMVLLDLKWILHRCGPRAAAARGWGRHSFFQVTAHLTQVQAALLICALPRREMRRWQQFSCSAICYWLSSLAISRLFFFKQILQLTIRSCNQFLKSIFKASL